MKNIINIYKPVGISPLDAINILKEKNLEYQDVSVTYAGRLDPMAEGVLILLAGDEVHKKEEYQKLDKEYEAEILFGFETDTYDILGIPQVLQLTVVLEELENSMKKEIESLKGEISLPLPPYSSYKIQGKPLFMWAREGELDEVEIPMRTTTVHKAELLDSSEISADGLLEQITKKIGLVKGNFRQEEILRIWQEVLNKGDQKYLVAKVRFSVSSGTYVRSIAHSLGGILLGLIRTKVGSFDIKDSTRT
jgi:tRNA pseudouridine55 synthase